MLDIIKCSLKNLTRKKIRSFLTILGVSIGVASVIVIGNISQCGSSAITGELDSLGLGGLTITSNSSNSTPCFLSYDELKVIKQNNYVKQASPIMMQNTNVYTGFNQTNSFLWGIDSKVNQIISLQVLYGRGINSSDVKSYSNVCMVDQNFSKAMYGRDNIIGKKISIQCGNIMEEFEIIGIIKTGNGILQNVIGDYIPNFVYIPYTTMQNATGRKSFDQIAVKIKEGSNVDTVGEDIVRSLSRINGINDGYHSNSLSKQRQGLNNIMNIVTVILSSVGTISLFVASLSIMTVMLVSVNERTREIGIKKSIGASKKNILLEFLTEALLLSIIGCIVGSIIGMTVSYIGAWLFGINLMLRMDIIIMAILFSVITGIIFGVYPALKASNLKPVDALRAE